jgi:hypothetical protein
MADEPIDFSEEENNRQREEERTVRDGLIKSLQSELAAINEDVAERIKKRKDLEKLHRETESEIKIVQERIKLLGEAGTDEEKRQKEKLESRLSQLTNQEKAQRERIEQQKKSDEERTADRDLLARQLNEMGGTPRPEVPEADPANGPDYSELRQNAREVSKAWNRHVSVISRLKSPFLNMVAEWMRTQKVYTANRLANEQLLKELQDEIKALQEKQKDSELSDKEKSELQKKQGEAEKLTTDMKVASTMRYISITNLVANYMKQLGKAITQFVDVIRKTQREFAITAGDATKLKFKNIIQSARSFASALETAGKTVPVTAEEIQRAQLDFQEQFGMLFDEKEAGVLAAQAKELGLTSQQLAEARRVFLTQAMGDVSQVKGLEDQFRTGFEDVLGPGGAKAAFEFIGKNSELMARSGTRFQQSLIKAAAEAKKIGVELSKVNQIGDNIIGDFEGFLDGMAELGAMGFGFDTFRLAQIAETGDTGALFQELRSQLAMTGKDITNLRRSEQLALSRTFGMNIEEFQRMAGGDFEKPIDPIDLQQEANGFLSKAVNFLEKLLTNNPVYEWLTGQTAANFLEGIGKTAYFVAAAVSTAVQIGLLGKIAYNTGGIFRLSGLLGRGGGGVTPPPPATGGGTPTARGGSPSAGGGTPTARGGSPSAGGGTSATSPTSASRLAGVGRVAGRALPLVSGAVVVGSGAMEFNRASQAEERGEITAQEARTQRGGAVGSTAGGLAGMLAGAKLGAMAGGAAGIPIGGIGAIPMAAVGGLIGGTVGLIGGSRLGRAGGESLAGEPPTPTAAAAAPTPVVTSEEAITTGRRTNRTETVAPQEISVNVDMVKLERKLDQVIGALGTMEVNMDGIRVGQVLSASEGRALTDAVFRAQRL